MIHDYRYAVRSLRKSPAFTAGAVIALALGIGANTAIFSVVNAVLLRPLPLRDADRAVVLWEASPAQGWTRIEPSGPDFLDFREKTASFEDLALAEGGTGTVTGFGEPRQVPGARVSNNFLSVLGVKPILGRDFLPTEGFNHRVAILSYEHWNGFFGKDPRVIGSKVTADGLAYTIIGILPPSFWSPVPAGVFVPWADSDLRAMPRMAHGFGVIGHLKPGVSRQQANAELDALVHRIGEQFLGMKNWSSSVVPLQEAVAENVRAPLVLLLSAVAAVLLIACANLANLTLARAAGRAHETAIRLALGAGRVRLVRQFLAESSILALLGGTLGLLLALWGVRLMDTLLPDTIRLAGGAGEILRPRIGIDLAVLCFTLIASCATALVFGLAPALTASRVDVAQLGRTRTPAGQRLRAAFAASEVAFALVLVVGAMLLIKSFWRIRQIEPGFSAARVLTLEIELPTDSKYRTAQEQAGFFRRVLANTAAVPAVRSAGVTSLLPLDPGEATVGFTIENRAPLPSGQSLPADYRAVSPEYFRAMGIPLRRGRWFDDLDKDGRPLVAVINETLARQYWPNGADPVGQRLRFGKQGLREIVGVVADVRHAGLDRRPAPAIYTCYLQSPAARMNLVVKTAADPASLVRAIKDQVYAVDRDQPVYKIRTMERVVADSQSSPRMTLALLAVFAAVALMMAAAGIYGVLSYVVVQRTREIGIRLAIGAPGPQVISLILSQGLRLTAYGLIVGIAAAFVLTRWMASLLYGVSATDPLVFAGVAALMAAVACAACSLPALRAVRLDPLVALRCD
jgi:putative ABC transport system permease protein